MSDDIFNYLLASQCIEAEQQSRALEIGANLFTNLICGDSYSRSSRYEDPEVLKVRYCNELANRQLSIQESQANKEIELKNRELDLEEKK